MSVAIYMSFTFSSVCFFFISVLVCFFFVCLFVESLDPSCLFHVIVKQLWSVNRLVPPLKVLCLTQVLRHPLKLGKTMLLSKVDYMVPQPGVQTGIQTCSYKLTCLLKWRFVELKLRDLRI